MTNIPNEKLNTIFPDMVLYKLDETVAKTVEFTGNNERDTLIASNITDTESLSFLTKILSAVKFDLQNDVALVNLTKQEGISYKDLKNCLKFDKLICFGIDMKDLGIHIKAPLYKKTDWNQIQILLAEDLQSIAESQQKKGLLWNALKEFFAI